MRILDGFFYLNLSNALVKNFWQVHFLLGVMFVKYIKLPTTYIEQLRILKSRNINIICEKQATEIIKHHNYYRLSAYFLPFEKSRHIFEKNISLKDVVSLYEFDRKFRLLLDEILEIIEISIRSILAYQLSHKYGAFAHLNSANFNDSFDHTEWLSHIRLETERSREIFIKHYSEKYDEYPDLPIWMAIEVISFGRIIRLILNLKKDDQIELAKQFGLHHKIFCSWILSFNYIRNLCAHFGRLIFKKLSLKIAIPKKNNWEDFADSDKIGIMLFCFNKFFKNIDPVIFDLDDWKMRIEKLLIEKNENINLHNLIGLKNKLQDNPFWNN
jgi:abortive infection bacteriophage resistance protein